MAEADPSRGTVLHVEDDAAYAASVKVLLKSEGFRALVARDGEQALALLAGTALRPDVLIVDFNLPGEMDGSEVAEAVARALGRPLPTIVLSGDLTSAGLPWLPGAPLWPMRKPVSPEMLVKAVEVFADLQHWIDAHPARRPAASSAARRRADA
jgi:two-component system CheB/CheR fusion protein